jgi:hypothetical protein
MKLDLSKHTNPFHHFYLIEGDIENTVSGITTHLGELGFTPDATRHITKDHFTIDDAHELQHSQIETTDTLKKFFIVTFNTIGHEAEQSLLKTLEEPKEGTHFFFVTPRIRGIRDTILSRCYKIIGDTASDSSIEKMVKDFLKGNSVDRLVQVAEILESAEEESNLPKTFTRALMQQVYESFSIEKKEEREVIEKTAELCGYIENRGASEKYILETLALTIPQTDSSL